MRCVGSTKCTVRKGTTPTACRIYVRIELGSADPGFSVELVQTLTCLAYEQLRVGDVQLGLATLSRAREAAAGESRPYVIAWLAAAETDALLSLNRLDDALAAGQQPSTDPRPRLRCDLRRQPPGRASRRGAAGPRPGGPCRRPDRLDDC